MVIQMMLISTADDDEQHQQLGSQAAINEEGVLEGLGGGGRNRWREGRGQLSGHLQSSNQLYPISGLEQEQQQQHWSLDFKHQLIQM